MILYRGEKVELAIVICTIAIMRGITDIVNKYYELKKLELTESKYKEWLKDD